MPYIRAKAHDYFEELGGGVNSEILDETLDVRQIQALTDQVCTFFLLNLIFIHRIARPSRGDFVECLKLFIPISTRLSNYGSYCGI